MTITSIENSQELCFVCDESALSGVQKISRKVALDVERVFGFAPAASHVLEDVRKDAVIFGTVGNSMSESTPMGTIAAYYK